MSAASSHNIVIIDNYDSYVYNLYQRFGEITGRAATVVRNDRARVRDILALDPTHLVISPGPGSPDDPSYFGICGELLLELGRRVPVLGVCLGHQGIGSVFGGRVVRAAQPMHGKCSPVLHDGTGVFQGLASPLTGMRYHSLVLAQDCVPACLRVTARLADGTIMGVEHREYPIHGVQFHPESIGTPAGPSLLRNFLALRAKESVRQPAALAAAT